ncbi:hypothetical protein LRQ20_29625 [Pseudomonas sp. MAFF 311096]|uniref:Uncharacterized protein n=1 Tax=Pseudomonas petroselini TaxID=2899822 RepID=A0ABS8R391_9PSED|nr:hypothetical protein [Pseudomonas petroselini]MCD7042447.1 hypothetical protein [Pseudomonas petroselini]MCD7047824.1 hypothetical protein [Pseudomonas petroselini]MCD7072259.1 hypothetical protein [Pseudomonas petroselini]
MWIGHRFERTVQDDLLIHSHNPVQSAVVWWVGGLALSVPVVFVVCGIIEGYLPLVGLHPLSSLLIVLALLLMPAMGLFLMVYTGIRETLRLSRHDGEAQRLTRNAFGRRERVRQAFRLDHPHALELRRRPQAKPIYTQLWLVMRDGTEHRLTPDNVPVVPGSPRTERWLAELAGYLNLAVPTDVIDASAPREPPYRPAPSPAKVARAQKGKEPAPSAESTEAVGLPARGLLGLLGAFLAVLELSQLFALVPALFTGRLRVSGFRSRATTFYWAEQPVTFSFNLLIGVVEVVIVGYIAWACLRIALQGRFKSAP